MALTKQSFYAQPDPEDEADVCPGTEVPLPSRGNDVSEELTEVRTVLKRAETALQNIRDARAGATSRAWSRYPQPFNHDPDTDEMILVLEQAVQGLAKWRKTGRTKNVVNNRY
jgi:hypothetical protein